MTLTLTIEPTAVSYKLSVIARGKDWCVEDTKELWDIPNIPVTERQAVLAGMQLLEEVSNTL